MVSLTIRVITINLFACCVAAKEDEKRCAVAVHKQRLADIYVYNLEGMAAKVGGIVGPPKKKSKSAYFPLLIRMPQGAKLPIFLDYLYSRKNKLITGKT